MIRSYCLTLRLVHAVVLLVASIPLQAVAHDYWFEPADEELVLVRGHRDFSAHSGDEQVPYTADAVTRIVCRSASGDRVVASGNSYPVSVPADCDQLLVAVDSGFWSQTLTGTRNLPPAGLFGVLKSWQALETVKRIQVWQAAAAGPLGNGLELLLERDPSGVMIDDKLRLQAVADGKPVANVSVAYDGKVRGATGADGRINVRVRHGGWQMITASLEDNPPGLGVDKRIRSTTLMVELSANP